MVNSAHDARLSDKNYRHTFVARISAHDAPRILLLTTHYSPFTSFCALQFLLHERNKNKCMTKK